MTFCKKAASLWLQNEGQIYQKSVQNENACSMRFQIEFTIDFERLKPAFDALVEAESLFS